MSFDDYKDRRFESSLKFDRYPHDVMPFWVADMDFQSPQPVIEALVERAKHGIYGYTLPPKSLLETIQQDLKDVYNWEIDTDWIIWLPGLVPALNVAAVAYAAKGEEIISPIPVYPPFLTAPKLRKRKLVTVEAEWRGNEWVLPLENLEVACSEKSRVFYFCNPHNPLGKIYSKAEITEIAEYCIDKGMVFCSDEIHCDLLLEQDAKHIPAASINEKIAQNSITLMAPSKTYNVPGLSCSFVIIPNDDLRRKFKAESVGYFNEINCFGYAACEAAYKYGKPWLEDLKKYLKQNYDLVYKKVSSLSGVDLKPMQATYLAWIEIKDLNLNNAAKHFEYYKIALSDGNPFQGKNHLRLNFATSRERLVEGMNRFEQGVLDALKGIDHSLQ
ncbi:MAG: PatB family C-S lyase [Lentisphaeria bacterium]|nr:PatB family C-S lyase [Lentisphaeria bacterium]